MIRKYIFDVVKLQERKRRRCSICGKYVNRQQTFFQTMNPFNKNPDGTIKRYDNILNELKQEVIKWKTEPVKCHSHIEGNDETT